jgi:FlaG/FlaF family flagellin (archaellin)
MKLMKIIMTTALCATITSSLLPLNTYASQNTNAHATTIQSRVVNNSSEISKLDKYVTLNTTTKQFQISVSAKQNLTKDEFNSLTSLVEKSNNFIKKEAKDSSLSLNCTSQKSIDIVQKASSKSITPMTIDTSKYWDSDVHWWGTRIFLSRAFVNTLQGIGQEYGYIGGQGSTTLGALLIKAGMSVVLAGTIASVVGLEAMYDYDQITSKCDDTGVYVDLNWLGGPNIYGA